MRLSRLVPAVAAAAALSLLAACGSTPQEPSPTSIGSVGTAVPTDGVGIDAVTASGAVDLKTAPEVAFASTPVRSTEVTRQVLTPGTGAEATPSSMVTVRLRIYNGTSGKLVDDGFAEGREPETYRLGRPDLVQGFAEGLVGAQAGGRLAFAIPPAKAFGPEGNTALGISGTDTIVVVADVAAVESVLAKIEGTQQPSPAGLPTVAFPDGPTKSPQVTVPKSDPPTETQAVTLIEGTGKTVEKGQTLAAHYHGVLWKDGSVFDSSWERGAASDFPIGVGRVVAGWDSTLVGQKVGSRVLLVIPPKDGYGEQGSPPKITGTDTLVFVVDILGAY